MGWGAPNHSPRECRALLSARHERYPAPRPSAPPFPLRALMALALTPRSSRALPPPSATHLPALDGLRGCAVLMVMLYHFTAALEHPVSLGGALVRKAFSGGWIGVDLFFVLSGYLITGILFDAKGANEEGEGRRTPARRYFGAFYGRRALRIFPLYYGVLALLFVVVPVALALGGTAPSPAYARLAAAQGWFWSYLVNFLAIHPDPYGVGHFWSLAIEEQFYLVWPLVIWLCSRERALLVCAVCATGALIFRCAALAAGLDAGSVYAFTPGRLDGLAAGAALALIQRGPVGLAPLRSAVRPCVYAALAVLLSIVLRLRFLNAFDVQTQTVGFTATALLFGAVLLGVLTALPAAPERRALERPALRFFGRYSYALYVFHQPLVPLAARAGVTPAAAGRLLHSEALGLVAYTGVMLLASVGLALASWHLYEKHFLRLKKRFSYTERRPLVIGAPAEVRAAA